jgi:predicted transcriptional regulator
MASQGMTASEIATNLGITYESVRKSLRDSEKAGAA